MSYVNVPCLLSNILWCRNRQIRLWVGRASFRRWEFVFAKDQRLMTTCNYPYSICKRTVIWFCFCEKSSSVEQGDGIRAQFVSEDVLTQHCRQFCLLPLSGVYIIRRVLSHRSCVFASAALDGERRRSADFGYVVQEIFLVRFHQRNILLQLCLGYAIYSADWLDYYDCARSLPRRLPCNKYMLLPSCVSRYSRHSNSLYWWPC